MEKEIKKLSSKELAIEYTKISDFLSFLDKEYKNAKKNMEDNTNE